MKKSHIVSLRSSKKSVPFYHTTKSLSTGHGRSNFLSLILHLLPPSCSFSEAFLQLRLISSSTLVKLQSVHPHSQFFP